MITFSTRWILFQKRKETIPSAQKKTCVGWKKTAPKELVFSVPRFVKQGDSYTKNTEKLIEIPRSSFRLQKEYFETPALNPFEYDLRAAVIHKGETMDSGHYTALINDHGTWFELDDEKVELRNDKEVENLLKNSYMLHYSAQDSIFLD